MNIIQHYKDCDLRLLGWVVENWPVKHGIASVNEFKSSARTHRRATGPATAPSAGSGTSPRRSTPPARPVTMPSTASWSPTARRCASC